MSVSVQFRKKTKPKISKAIEFQFNQNYRQTVVKWRVSSYPHKPNLAFVILSGKLDARVSRILAAWPAHPKVGSGNEPDISCLSTTIIRPHPRCC